MYLYRSHLTQNVRESLQEGQFHLLTGIHRLRVTAVQKQKSAVVWNPIRAAWGQW